MVADGTWPGKRAPKLEMIEIFIAKTTWFDYYTPNFPRVSNYPNLELWLQNDHEGGTDMEVWGYEQAVYGWKDLQDFLKRGGPVAAVEESEEEIVPKKRKGKERTQGEKTEKRRKGSGSTRLYRRT
jgi:hypothetical protein